MSRPAGSGDFEEALFAWPEGTFLQGGHKGIVFVKGMNESYTTTFVEVYVPNVADSGFYRGEGATVAEAEESAWNKYQRAGNCPHHEWESRGYTNGGGFCKHCNTFGSKVIDPRDLGQFCYVCGTPTTHGQTTATAIMTGVGIHDYKSVEEKVWACQDHYPQELYDNTDLIDEEKRS